MDKDPKNENVVEYDETERDDEFEYDENGDIIVPDVDFSDETDTDNDTDESEDSADEENDEEDNADAEDNQDEEKEESSEESDEGKEEKTPPAEDEKDKIIAELKKRNEELSKGNEQLSNQTKATLKALGVENPEDIIGALEQLAAESEGISLDDYKKRKLEQQKSDEAQRALKRIEFEKMVQSDLAALKAAYPETATITSIDQIENFAQFAKLRDLGVPAVEAYAAANIESIKKSVAASTKQQDLNATKKHLQSSVPKNATDTTTSMSREEYNMLKELFPGKSKKELEALYKQTK